jgi:transcription initiation factor TFIIIB Brf1 subunit/transcription initiation factor TFIIB
MAKKENPKHLNLCTIKEVAQFVDFTEQNIRDRYKNVEGKENHYNSLQLGTYFNKFNIDAVEFFNLIAIYKEVKGSKILARKILNHHLD